MRRAVARMAAGQHALREGVAELVATELGTNLLRHAHPGGYVLARSGDELLLDVTDNGRGIAPSVTRSSGLTNLRRRAEKLGGTFEVADRPEGGTRMRWRIPLTTEDVARTL